MLDWMLQQDAYTGHASLLTSCSPGGPPLGPLVSNTSAAVTVNNLLPPPTSIIVDTLITDGLGDMPKAGLVMATPGKDLTVLTTITVTSAGCFNPEACPNIKAS